MTSKPCKYSHAHPSSPSPISLRYCIDPSAIPPAVSSTSVRGVGIKGHHKTLRTAAYPRAKQRQSEHPLAAAQSIATMNGSGRQDVWNADQQAMAETSKSVPSGPAGDKLVVCKGDSDWSSVEDKEEASYHETVLAQLGYGKNGASNARFSWWIMLLCAVFCIAGYAAWLALMLSARNITNDALAGYGVSIAMWSKATALMTVLAVVFPIVVVAALGVSAWRWKLASSLDIHRPDAKWMAQSRRFQATNAVANSLLWVLLALLVVGGGTMWAWAFAGQTARFSSNLALTYVDPVWSGLTDILNTTSGVVSTVSDLASTLPAVGRRRMLMAADVLGVDRSVVLAALEQGPQAHNFDPTLPQAPAAASAAALDGSEMRAVRKLQQLNGLLQGIGNFVQNVQVQGITNATRDLANSAAPAISNFTQRAAPVISNLTTAAAPLLQALPSVLPNGSSNPLFNAIDDLLAVVNGRANGTAGCPVYCLNLANSSWITGDPCICNLDRVRRGAGPASQISTKVMGAFAALMVMYAGCTWLLMHGASQWTRARTEAKLMERIPGARGMQSIVIAAGNDGGVAGGRSAGAGPRAAGAGMV